jgi:acyl-homoserine lactone acylase PvdQ
MKHSQWYDIMLQVEKALPFRRMECVVGATSDGLDKKDCEKDDPIVRADWTVWEEGRIVEWGSMRDCCGSIFTKENIYKQIGSFPLEAGNNYVVQVHFTKDGSPLNVANPHLIVIPHRDMW